MSFFAQAIQRDTRANQPLANNVVVGTLFYVTDEGVTERSNGSAWETYTDSVDVSSASYTPDGEGCWSAPAPTTVQEALDTLDDRVCVLEAGGGEGGGAGSSAWTLVDSFTHSGDVASVTFANLGGYTDIMVFISGITLASSGLRILHVSTDNGSTFLTTSGNYITIANTGIEANSGRLVFHDTASASARSGFIFINGFNLSGAVKFARMHTTTEVPSRVINTSTALNAIRISDSGASNITGGSIFVYGR